MAIDKGKALGRILRGGKAGKFALMPVDDLQTAISEGWAEPVGGHKPAPADRKPYKKADAYFERVADERDKALRVGKYSNRMLETGGPSERPKPQAPAAPPAPIIDVGSDDEPEEGAIKRGPGRPKKTETRG